MTGSIRFSSPALCSRPSSTSHAAVRRDAERVLFVGDPDERQAMRGRLRGELPRIGPPQEPGDPVLRGLSPSDVREYAADRPDHPAQESVSAKQRADLLAPLFDADGVQPPDSAL